MRRALALGRFMVGGALLVWVLSRIGIAELADRLLAAPWIVPALVGLSVIGAGIEAGRLGMLFGAQGIPLRFGAAYRLVTVATFFNFCVPGGTGGDVVKLYYLGTGNRGRGVEVATILLVDRVIAAFALLLLVLVLSLLRPGLAWSHPSLRVLLGLVAVILAAVLVATAIAWSASVRGSRAYGALLGRLPLQAQIRRALDALYAFRDHRRAVVRACLLSLVGHGILMVTFIAIGSVVLPGVPPVLTGVLAMLGMVANALPVTPGGLGVGEAAFAQLFGLAGHSGGAVLLVGWRIGMMPLATAGGFLYMAGAATYRHRSVATPVVETREPDTVAGPLLR